MYYNSTTMESKQNTIIIILIVISMIVFIGGTYLVLEKNELVNNEEDSAESLHAGGITLISPTSSVATSTEANDTKQNASRATSTQSTSTQPTLYVGKEVPGQAVFVDIAVLTEPGFVVIYEASALPTGELLGHSLFLEKGEHTNIPIRLFRPVEDGESFDVFIHKDNGDEAFLLKDDPPYRKPDGQAVFDELVIESLE